MNHRSLRAAYLLVLLALNANPNVSAQGDRAPKGWKWVDPCSASFLIPTKLKLQKSDEKPIDSCFATYGDGKLVVSVSEDFYAPGFERNPYWQDYTESPLSVGPLTGYLITFRRASGRKLDKVTNITWLRLGIVRDNAATFSLLISADPSIDPETVNKIRSSVRFKGPTDNSRQR